MLWLHFGCSAAARGQSICAVSMLYLRCISLLCCYDADKL